MAPMSRGQISKVTKSRTPKQNKDGTSNRHRFQSFSEKIASLKIDPVRRSDRSTDLGTRTSHFRSSLEEWRALNLSENFTTFSDQVNVLCNSLPQLLHHQQQIVDILVTFIEKRDVHSLQPLLSLVAHFAHDLGTRFEEHFERVVTIICRLASTHEDVEVIEWSFDCLAWLFKYLSRLLVPDLRAVFDLMAPLLGKESQKSYVTRFAAEAMSFLIRKTGSARHREALSLIVKHAFQDLDTSSLDRKEQYQHGLATLFAESMKGVQRGLHSSAVPIFETMLESVLHVVNDTAADTASGELFEASLINTMHDTDANGIDPIVIASLQVISTQRIDRDTAKSKIATRLLFVLVAFRKGSRIRDWHSIHRHLIKLIESAEQNCSPKDTVVISGILEIAAVYLQYCPLETFLQAGRDLPENFTKGVWQSQFLEFCAFSEKIGKERFDSFVRLHMERYIVQHWTKHKDEVSMLLPKLMADKRLENSVQMKSELHEQVFRELQNIVTLNGNLQPEDHTMLYRCNRLLDSYNSTTIDSVKSASVGELIGGIMRTSLVESSTPISDQLKAFATSSLLVTAAKPGIDVIIKPAVWAQICQLSETSCRNTQYLDAILQLLHHKPDLASASACTEALVTNMITIVTAQSHTLRIKGLEILKAIYVARDRDIPEGLHIAISLESSSFTMDSARSASTSVKRMGALHKTTNDSWMQRLLPAYCFGLLHVKLASVWTDACEALEVMSTNKASEDFIVALAVSWLEASEESSQIQVPKSCSDQPRSDQPSNFVCTNLLQLDRLHHEVGEENRSASKLLQEYFESTTSKLAVGSLQNRSQALLMLRKNSQLAERRSRLLVPHLLDLQYDSSTDNLNDLELGSEDETLTSQEVSHASEKHRWTRKDQKAFLEVFAQFSNPKMLYRSDEVRQLLLDLLCNGDSEIQQSALKALFAWKDPFIYPYRENLLNLLDNSRFREELTVFVDVASNDSNIGQEHRQDLLPVLLRILYGRMVARGGSSSNRGSQESKRKSVLSLLSRFNQNQIGTFIAIALGPLDKLSFETHGSLDESFFHQGTISSRRQFGLLRTFQDMLDAVPNVLLPFVDAILRATLFCHGLSSRKLGITSKRYQPLSNKEAESGLLKSIRQVSLKCLQLLFLNYPGFAWSAYCPIIFSEMVNSRLEKLPSENAQGVSTILHIFSTLSKSNDLIHWLWRPRPELLSIVADCLVTNSVQDEVRLFILDHILRNVIVFAQQDCESDEAVASQAQIIHLLQQEGLSYQILTRITAVVRACPPRASLEACVKCLIGLGQFLKQSEEAQHLLETSYRLLKLPSSMTSPRLKSQILHLLAKALPLVRLDSNSSNFLECLKTISALFSFFIDAENRKQLIVVLELVTHDAEKFSSVVEVCSGLNAWSSSRLDDPDYERRLQSFHKINDELYTHLDLEQWIPIAHNALFFIKDDVDLATRRSASLCLRRFVQVVEGADDMKQFLDDFILPAIQNGIRESSELVRAEFIIVLAEIIQHNHPGTQDMKCLLGPDEESSFFNNIYHLQQHRRARALRRLSSETIHITSENIGRFCLPLVEQHLEDPDEASQNTAAEAVNTIEVVAAGLEWQRYRALLHKMATRISKLESRLPIRILGAVVNALYRSAGLRLDRKPGEYAEEVDINFPKRLSETLPEQDKLMDVLSRSVLPTLTDHLHFKDESTVELRILVAPIAIKICLSFPPDSTSNKMSGILMDTCNVLKSRAQEARDSARKALADISLLIGPSYFGFTLKQLRTSLQRGYQIHVLCYTVHQLLVNMSSQFQLGSLDYCIPDIMNVIIDETFGNIAQEKEAKDYTSSMKEVKKKNLGFDSMEILATMVTMPHVSSLLNPIQAQLSLPRPKTEKIQELLRRLREGLRRNKSANDRRILTLCYEVMRDARKINQQGQSNFRAPSHQLVAFATDLLRRTLDKHEELKTAENLSAFVPILQESLDEGDEEVQIAAIKCLTSIIKVPITEIDVHSGDYLRRVRKLVEASSSTNAPLAQAALRLASAVLRERSQAVIKQSQFEAHVSYLLNRIKPDLQEPSRQGERDRQVAAFNFIRAVLGRGVLMKEIYEVMEIVREVMVTSNEAPIPDLSRSVYSRFILDYFPNKGKGLSRQVDYLISNLQYPNSRGQRSVLEVIMFLMTKKDDESVQPLLTDFFLPLVLAGETTETDGFQENIQPVLHKLFERANKERTKILKTQLHSWTGKDADPTWKGIAFRCWKIYLNVHDVSEDETGIIFKNTASAIRASLKAPTYEASPILDAALELIQDFSILMPTTVFAESAKKTWIAIVEQANKTSARTKLVSLQLIANLLTDFARSAASKDATLDLPMEGSGGLKFGEEDTTVLAQCHVSLLQERLSVELSSLLVKNLAFIGRISTPGSDDILPYIIRETSTILKAAENESSIQSKAVAVKVVSTLCKSLPEDTVRDNLHALLVPLQALTDVNIPVAWSADPEYSTLNAEIKTTAQDAMESLQEIVGSTSFLNEMQKISKFVKERRDERRAKRRIEVVAAPEKAMYKKQKKHDAGKMKRKEKNAKNAGRRRGW